MLAIACGNLKAQMYWSENPVEDFRPGNDGNGTQARPYIISKPAHLAYEDIIIYRTWGMVSHLAWGNAAAYTWDQLREEPI